MRSDRYASPEPRQPVLGVTFLSLTCSLTMIACGSADISVEELTGRQLSIVSGDGQVAPAGSTLLEPLVVQSTLNGSALPAYVVNWVVVEGGGSVFGGVSETDEDGYAREWWTLGAAGPQTLEVRAVDPTTGERRVFAEFHATASNATCHGWRPRGVPFGNDAFQFSTIQPPSKTPIPAPR